MSYPTDLLREIAARVIADNPKYLNMKENQEDANGLRFCLDMYCSLPGRDGALWRQVMCLLAKDYPGLVDRTPSPDNVLKRGREVKKATKENGLVRPAIRQVV